MESPSIFAPKHVQNMGYFFLVQNVCMAKWTPIYWTKLPSTVSQTDPRWMESMHNVQCVFIKQDNPQDYVWRRLQVSDVQAERQKKSILQMCPTFHARAQELEKQDSLGMFLK